jgi:hypothetical protein
MARLHYLVSTSRQQRGAIVLVTVVLMLVMITLVTLYTGKIQSFEHKILLNSQNQTLAFSAAESGMMRGLAELQQNKMWPADAINDVLMGQERFSVNATKQTIIRQLYQVDLFDLSAVGVSADGLARATIQQQVLVYPLLTQIPSAAVLVSGGINKQASFEIAANPNGVGEGVPLSIWTDGNTDLTQGNGFTCGLQEYQDGQCQTLAYSSTVHEGEDVLSNDPGFPKDILAHLFNLSFAHYSALRDEADQRLAACNSLNQKTSGIIWVDGECDIAANLTLGSVSVPLLLFIHDGNLHLGAGTTLNGLIVMLKQINNVSSYDVFMPTTSLVNGALVANYELGSLAGSIRVKYDLAILQTLVNSAYLKRVAKVPGSWHDI